MYSYDDVLCVEKLVVLDERLIFLCWTSPAQKISNLLDKNQQDPMSLFSFLSFYLSCGLHL